MNTLLMKGQTVSDSLHESLNAHNDLTNRQKMKQTVNNSTRNEDFEAKPKARLSTNKTLP